MTQVTRQVNNYLIYSNEVSVTSGSDPEVITINTNEFVDTSTSLYLALNCEGGDTGNVAYNLNLLTHAGQLIENLTGNISATNGAAATIIELPFTVTNAVKYAKKITGTFTFPTGTTYSAKLMVGGFPLD